MEDSDGKDIGGRVFVPHCSSCKGPCGECYRNGVCDVRVFAVKVVRVFVFRAVKR